MYEIFQQIVTMINSVAMFMIPATGPPTTSPRTQIADRLEATAQTTFRDRYGCLVVGGKSWHLLVTSKEDVSQGQQLARSLGAEAYVVVRQIRPDLGGVALGRLNKAIIDAVGVDNPEAMLINGPPSTTRCSTLTLLVSDEAGTETRSFVKSGRASWGDRVTVRYVPPTVIPPPSQRAVAFSSR